MPPKSIGPVTLPDFTQYGFDENGQLEPFESMLVSFNNYAVSDVYDSGRYGECESILTVAFCLLLQYSRSVWITATTLVKP